MVGKHHTCLITSNPTYLKRTAHRVLSARAHMGCVGCATPEFFMVQHIELRRSGVLMIWKSMWELSFVPNTTGLMLDVRTFRRLGKLPGVWHEKLYPELGKRMSLQVKSSLRSDD